jgi:exodeoxyribonuclease V beta subunit
MLYLFLRGMCGPGTPQVEGTPCGVFAWKPPGALIAELSDLLDGGARRAARPTPPAQQPASPDGPPLFDLDGGTP